MELTYHAFATLILTAIALFLFSQEKYRLETSSLLILIVLTLLFTLSPFIRENGTRLEPADFFSGFGHEALVAICSLMILGKGIETTGALKPVTRILSRFWSKAPMLTFLLALIISAFMSAFLNNTPIVIMLIPILISVAISANTSPSKILLPVGLATLIGGMATTIGTSTNLLVVAIANDLSDIHFNMFDFALPVLIVGSVGILALWLFAPKMLPDRKIDLVNTSQRIYNAVLFLTDKSIAEDNELREVLKKTNHEVAVHRIQRKENQVILPLPTVQLRSGDILFISGTAEKLKDFETRLNGKLHNINKQGGFDEGEYAEKEDDQVIAEVLVTGHSLLHNSSLKRARFAEKYNIIVLALHRLNKPAEKLTEKLGGIILNQGDILLVQGTREDINLIREDTKLLVLDNVIDYVSSKKSPIALGIMTSVILLAAMNVLPISVSSLCGAGFMLMTRCIGWRDINKALNAQVILIIVVSLALGRALIDTGGADYLAFQFVQVTDNLPIIAILSALLFLISIITNIVSNTAAAVVGTPVAMNIAQQLGAPLEPFILAVLFGANMSYATPIGYQTNLLIYSAGGYRFSDYLRVGVPLTIIVGAGFTLVLAWFYDLA